MLEHTTRQPAASSRHRHQRRRERRQPDMSLDPASTGLLGCVRSSDVAVYERSPQTMLVTATTGFAAGIEAGYRLAQHVDDLSTPVDPQTTIRIVPDWIECRGVERWTIDLIHGCIWSPCELRIATLVHVRIPLGYRFLQVRQRNPLELVTLLDLSGQLFDRIGAEEESVGR